MDTLASGTLTWFNPFFSHSTKNDICSLSIYYTFKSWIWNIWSKIMKWSQTIWPSTACQILMLTLLTPLTFSWRSSTYPRVGLDVAHLMSSFSTDGKWYVHFCLPRYVYLPKRKICLPPNRGSAMGTMYSTKALHMKSQVMTKVNTIILRAKC